MAPAQLRQQRGDGVTAPGAASIQQLVPWCHHLALILDPKREGHLSNGDGAAGRVVPRIEVERGTAAVMQKLLGFSQQKPQNFVVTATWLRAAPNHVSTCVPRPHRPF